MPARDLRFLAAATSHFMAKPSALCGLNGKGTCAGDAAGAGWKQSVVGRAGQEGGGGWKGMDSGSGWMGDRGESGGEKGRAPICV